MVLTTPLLDLKIYYIDMKLSWFAFGVKVPCIRMDDGGEES